MTKLPRIPFVTLLAWGVVLAAGCGPSLGHVRSEPMPEGGTFHGVWFSPQYGRMHLCQSEDTVVGEYVKDERHGTIQGRVQGNLLRFEWHERRELVSGRPMEVGGHGYFQLRIPNAEDGSQYIFGEWGYDDDAVGGGPWNAGKVPRERPTECYASVRGGRGGSNPNDGDIRFSDEIEESGETQSTDGTGTAGSP